MAYIFEVVEEVGDGFPLGVGKDIIVVDFGAAWIEQRDSSAIVQERMRRQRELSEESLLTPATGEQFATQVGHAASTRPQQARRSWWRWEEGW